MKDRAILHCDANNFFASVECVYNPELKLVPIAVTGDPETRTGIVVARNMLAKNFGVKVGDVIWEAKKKCPSLITVKQNRERYILYSKKLIQIYSKYTDRVEPFGIDECWLDITGSLGLLNKTAIEVADEIRETVKNELGLTISVGVSFCKLFAKLGSDLKKPDATTIICRESFKQIIFPLDLSEVLGVGRRIYKKFKSIGIEKIGDFVKLEDAYLTKVFNKTLVELKYKLLGDDYDDVSSIFEPTEIKSVGNGTTTIKDIYEKKDIETVINYLSDEVSTKLRIQNLKSNLIHVSIKTNDFKNYGKQRKIGYYTDSAKDITTEAFSLLEEFWDYRLKIRMIRIKCGNLASKNNPKQISFFDTNTEVRKENLNKVIDDIRSKYGYGSIDFADILSSKIINNQIRLD